MSTRHNTEVGHWLRTLRESLPGSGPGGRLTQREAVEQIRRNTEAVLEEAVIISTQELSRLEKGQTDSPSAESLCAVALGYRVDILELLGHYGYYPKGHTEEIDLRFVEYGRQFGHLSEYTQRRVLDTLEMLLISAVQIDHRGPDGGGGAPHANGKAAPDEVPKPKRRRRA